MPVMEAGPYDMAILCAATGDHAAYTGAPGRRTVSTFSWKKPFAALHPQTARRMIAAMEGTGKQMAINWPLRWVRKPCPPPSA